ncbi:MAG TPA: hypothetical protein VF215_01230 [Thermoanaerobaculia bacterium]
MKRLLVLLALLGLPAVAAAQSSDDLPAAFRAVAGLWARGDANGLVRYMAPQGLSIDVSDGPMGPLNGRQTAALLRQLFEQGETVGVQTGMLERVGGRPPRAFGAITWITRPEGTRVPVRRTVYFGLEWANGGWKVAEIRLIP